MHGDEQLVLLIVLALAALVGAPILALMAWVRVRRLERVRHAAPSDQTGDIRGITKRIQALEDRFDQLHRNASMVPPIASGVEPVPAPPQPSSAVVSATPPTADAVLPPPSAAPASTSSAPAPIFSGTSPERAPVDLENQIAGRWMNRVGLVAVAIGMSYFLKYAIDNDWIGPAGQVAIGLLLGAGLVAVGPVFLRKGLVYFADGITGLGAAVLYLSLWAATSYYALIAQTAGFLAMIVVTAAILTIAVGRNSQRIAVLAMIGGFMTPALVSTGRDEQVVLFSYLALHNGALLALARARDWRFLELPALAFTQLYVWVWFDRFYTATRLTATLAFASLFFGQFAAVPVIRSRRTGTLPPEQALLLILNAGLLLLVLHQTLWPDRKWALTFAVLLLAAVHLVLARAVPGGGRASPLPQLVLAGLALTFVTLAVPIRLSTRWITMAWAIEAAVITWTGLRVGLWYLRAAGFVLFGLVALRFLGSPLSADEFLFNVRFGTYVVAAAAVATSLWLYRQDASERTDLEQTAVRVLGVGLNLLVIVALTSEVSQFYQPAPGVAWTFDHRLGEGVSISVLWALYASGLILAGVRWSSQGLRWQGLILLGVTTLKVFFVDLGMLSGFYRVVSSIALGVVLLVISYVYQRRLAGRTPEVR